MLERVVHGFQCLRDAIKLAPRVWTAMLFRMALKREVHSFSLDVISSIMMHIGKKSPDRLWIRISRFLHDLERDYDSNKA